jgi:hypothetical protein
MQLRCPSAEPAKHVVWFRGDYLNQVMPSGSAIGMVPAVPGHPEDRPGRGQRLRVGKLADAAAAIDGAAQNQTPAAGVPACTVTHCFQLRGLGPGPARALERGSVSSPPQTSVVSQPASPRSGLG